MTRGAHACGAEVSVGEGVCRRRLRSAEAGSSGDSMGVSVWPVRPAGCVGGPRAKSPFGVGV
jgi:hypothetical protein